MYIVTTFYGNQITNLIFPTFNSYIWFIIKRYSTGLFQKEFQNPQILESNLLRRVVICWLLLIIKIYTEISIILYMNKPEIEWYIFSYSNLSNTTFLLECNVNKYNVIFLRNYIRILVWRSYFIYENVSPIFHSPWISGYMLIVRCILFQTQIFVMLMEKNNKTSLESLPFFVSMYFGSIYTKSTFDHWKFVEITNKLPRCILHF